MQTRIRIIKRGSQNERISEAADPSTKSDTQRARENAATVKAWIAEWHERKRSLQNAADSIINSLGVRGETPTKRLSAA